MSDYTKLTDFAAKDALSSGNPSKIVKGTEIDDEFDSIATNMATKADLASPALTGTPTTPTAATTTNSTQIASTAFVQQEIVANVPVGTVLVLATGASTTGYLACDGTAVSRAGYADLFAAIATTFGTGDGSTTFNLPTITDLGSDLSYYIKS